MDNVQRESFTGMIQLLEQVLENQEGCVADGRLVRFLEALADFTASRFYRLGIYDIPWMHKETMPDTHQMCDILTAYGIDAGTEEIDLFLESARDFFVTEYRKAVLTFLSE